MQGAADRAWHAEVMAADDLLREGTRLEALKAEAATGGDLAMVAVCDRALQGDVAALRECVRVLREAEAQLS